MCAKLKNIESKDSRSRRYSESSKAFEIKVSNLTSNIKTDHLKEIFGYIGKVSKVEMIDSKTDLQNKVGYRLF